MNIINKNFKGQDSIEVVMLTSVAIFIAVVVVAYLLKIGSTGANQIKNFNLNFISSFSYLSTNSIYLSLTENYNFTKFNMTIYPNMHYNYTVTSKGYNNYGDVSIIANSTNSYNSYTLGQICSLEYSIGKSVYAYTKNCTS